MLLPDVVIYSIFRDNEGDYIDSYFKRLRKLDWPEEHLKLIIAEGDSKDLTYRHLEQELYACNQKFDFTLLQYDTHRPYLDYCTTTDRLTTLATMYNLCIDEIVKQDWAQYAWLLESDIIFQPDFLSIIDDWVSDAGVLAPMPWIKGETGTYLYDLWGCRAFPDTIFSPTDSALVMTPDGEMIQHFPQRVFAWYAARMPNKLNEVAAACCSFVTDVQLFKKGVRCTNEDEAAGMQKQIRNLGKKIYINRHYSVFHPKEEVHLI